MRLIITRHPGTHEMKKGIVQGKNVGTVNEEGFEQIKKFVRRIQDEKIDRIISSDAKRCKTMAEEILKVKKIPYEFTGLIDEENYGIYIGKKASEIEMKYEGNTPETRKFPKGESLLELRGRTKRFLDSLKENYGKTDENILIISHSFFLSSFIGLILGLSPLESRRRFWINSCSFSEIEFGEKGPKIKTLNETNFLD